jgi:hypothetical protein
MENRNAVNENKPKLTFVEVDDIPTPILGPRNTEYDNAIPLLLSATKSTICLVMPGKTGKQMYPAIHERVKKYNGRLDREVDVTQRTIDDKVYLQKLEKGSLTQDKPT